jgi:4-coumarate--CoA ligase
MVYCSAYIVADPKKISADEVRKWVDEQVSNPKKLRGGVVFLPTIPKSPSGKILRNDLRDMAKKEGKDSKL